jgi:peroxiredoxin Q/BCP
VAKKKIAKKKTAKKQIAKSMTAKKVTSKKTAAKKSPVKSSAKKQLAVKGAPSMSVQPTHLVPGKAAPKLGIPNETGSVVSLSDYAGKTLVLYFYPKDDTPGCTQESCDFRDHFSRLSAESVVVLGISKDAVSSHVKFKNKYQLPFSLLSDETGEVCEAYGVWKEKSMYGRKYMGIERTTVIIDGKGKVVKVYPKVSVKGHVESILADIRSMRES